MKIVINKCFGGFGLSPLAIEEYAKRKGITLYTDEGKTGQYDSRYTDKEKTEFFSYDDIPRNDPVLIEVVETLGPKAEGAYSELKVVEIPNDVNWEIEEVDGNERICEKYRTWC